MLRVHVWNPGDYISNIFLFSLNSVSKSFTLKSNTTFGCRLHRLFSFGSFFSFGCMFVNKIESTMSRKMHEYLLQWLHSVANEIIIKNDRNYKSI